MCHIPVGMRHISTKSCTFRTKGKNSDQNEGFYSSEGYHRIAAKLAAAGTPVRGYIKVEYQAPAASTKF